jgi:hypothetical protein
MNKSILDELVENYDLLKANADSLPEEYKFLLEEPFKNQIENIKSNKDKIMFSAKKLMQRMGEKTINKERVAQLADVLSELGLIEVGESEGPGGGEGGANPNAGATGVEEKRDTTSPVKGVQDIPPTGPVMENEVNDKLGPTGASTGAPNIGGGVEGEEAPGIGEDETAPGEEGIPGVEGEEMPVEGEGAPMEEGMAPGENGELPPTGEAEGLTGLPQEEAIDTAAELGATAISGTTGPEHSHQEISLALKVLLHGISHSIKQDKPLTPQNIAAASPSPEDVETPPFMEDEEGLPPEESNEENEEFAPGEETEEEEESGEETPSFGKEKEGDKKPPFPPKKASGKKPTEKEEPKDEKPKEKEKNPDKKGFPSKGFPPKKD